MEPEIITPTPAGNKKKFFLFAIVIVLAIAGATYWYLFMQKETSKPVEEAVAVVPEIKISATDSAKLQILSDITSQTSTTTSSQEQKLQVLKSLQTKSPATAVSDTERLKILQSIAVQ